MSKRGRNWESKRERDTDRQDVLTPTSGTKRWRSFDTDRRVAGYRHVNGFLSRSILPATTVLFNHLLALFPPTSDRPRNYDGTKSKRRREPSFPRIPCHISRKHLGGHNWPTCLSCVQAWGTLIGSRKKKNKQTKPKVRGREETIKIIAKTNVMENIKKINNSKGYFFLNQQVWQSFS